MIDENIEAVAVAICQALGLNPLEPATPPSPGLPPLRWTQFVTAAEAARQKASETPRVVLPPLQSDARVIALTTDGRGNTAVHYAEKTTSPEVAGIAARGMRDPLSLTPDEIQAVCGSALVQR